MKLHRFYIGSKIELTHNLWIHDERLLRQWLKVLRFKAGQEVVLFDGVERDRLYKIIEINPKEAGLRLVTEYERQLPKQNIYLLWSLLKKDKNDWVLQKCTELSVSHFLPLLADRSEKTGFNLERAEKIVVEAAEQCGRSDIPNVRQPILVATALKEFLGKIDLYVAEQTAEQRYESKVRSHELATSHNSLPTTRVSDAVGVLVGPEGGWSDAEKQLFKENNLPHLNLHDFTLRAETAAITAIFKLLQ